MEARVIRMPHGERTRREILEVAERLAAREGLEGLTIGGLAEKVGMSKTGLYAHFGSKEALQLATIETAYRHFADEVVTPALERPPGVDQLRGVFELYFAYVQRRASNGGCFFTAAALEMDDRPGKVREEVARFVKMRDALVVEGLKQAVHRGELRKDVDVEQLAFELVALGAGASIEFQLFKQPAVLERVRVALQRRLDEASVPARGKRKPSH